MGSGSIGLGSVAYLLHIIGVILSILLGALSLYAWSRRSNRSLIFVSAAFFAFFVHVLIDEILPEGLTLEVASGVIDLIILGLFFLSIVVGINRSNSRLEREAIESEEPKSG
jgi:uncharacterized membrane protein